MTFTMIPRLEAISSSAHNAIVDGDDLHITGSDNGDEENYSTVANFSCRTRSCAVGNPDQPELTKNHSVDTSDDTVKDHEKVGIKFSKNSRKVMRILRKLGKSSKLLPSRFRQKSSLYLSSTKTVAEYEEMIEDELGLREEDNYAYDSETIVSLRSSRNNVRTGKSMLVRQKAQIINQPSTTHSNWGISQSPSSDLKGCRRNFMLRDKSLILDDSSIGGMSDITEDASSFYGFSNTMHLSFRRTPMFINTDTFCIDEDEDEDESESEDESLNDSEEIESRPSSDENIDRAYDFHELSPLNEVAESIPDDCSRLQFLAINEKQVTQLPQYDRVRRRVHSDSDIDSEAHWDVLNANSTVRKLSPLDLNPDLKNQEHFQDAVDPKINRSDKRSDRSRSSSDKSIGKYFEESTHYNSGSTLSRHVAMNASWPFPRTRTHSDSHVDQIPISNEFPSPSKEHSSVEIEIQDCSLLDTKPRSSMNHLKVDNMLPLRASLTRQSPRRQSLPLLERNVLSDWPTLRSRTYSDPVVYEKPEQKDILWDPRNNSLLDDDANMASSTNCTEGAFRTFGFDESPIASQAGRIRAQAFHNEKLSPTTKTIDMESIHPRPTTSSVLAMLSHTNNHVSDIIVATENRKPSQHPSFQNPSPRILNAASMIAAALRPAPAKRLPALPTQSPSAAAQQSDQYYWGIRDSGPFNISDKIDRDEDREIELKNLCSWSSESFDDIF